MKKTDLSALRVTSTCSWAVKILFSFLVISMSSIACDDDETQSCSNDQACTRGQVCSDSVCIEIPCQTIGECPGFGRTCLAGLNVCSAKECNDQLNGVLLECAEGSVCNENGAFAYSCSPSSGPSLCTIDSDCAMATEGNSCCNGLCAAMCDAPILMMDMGPGGDTSPPDMNPMPTEANLCMPCGNDGACASLGEGAKCTAIGEGNFCTSACSENTDCPTGFNCFATLGQCIPGNFECAACQQTPCDAGEFCNTTSGECGPPQGLCGNCSEDAGCADNRACRTINGNAACVQRCEEGCPTGTACVDGGCVPDSGICDPCAGMCAGGTPYCVAAEGRCAECGPTAPCDDGLRCDQMTFTCTDALPNGMCLVDSDCQGGGVCFNGTCVECFQDSDCPARNRCDTNSFTCQYSPCAGVECQRGSSCDMGSGRCNPGCTSNMDCALPDVMECNPQTGQCYNVDGSCDLSGDAVCAPGGQCMPNPLAFLDPTLPSSCTCAKENPMDPLSPDRVACHPGQSCNDLSAIFGDLSALGLDFDATCGEGLF